MLKKAKCKYCKGLFQPVRLGHRFCSDTCRKLQHKAKNRAKIQAKTKRRLGNKLQKLSNSAFGKYLVRELKRAGTVQALHGHTSETLKELALLRNNCTSAGGYEDGAPLNTYEVSHIHPVNDSEAVGLITPMNLTIAPAEFNRKHSSKKPTIGYKGEFLTRGQLLYKWRINDKSEALEILEIARVFIGKEFDIWLHSHTINQTQKQTLVKKLKGLGLPEKILIDLSIKELKTWADEEDLSYFNISKSPVEPQEMAIKELKRLRLAPELLQALEYLQECDWSLEDPEMEFIVVKEERLNFEAHLTWQAFACLHGQPFTTEYKNKPILKYFKEKAKRTLRSLAIGPELGDEIL